MTLSVGKSGPKFSADKSWKQFKEELKFSTDFHKKKFLMMVRESFLGFEPKNSLTNQTSLQFTLIILKRKSNYNQFEHGSLTLLI